MNTVSKVEDMLFESMKKIRLKPVRQHLISKMHVDFAFPDKKIAIEVDGPHHRTRQEIERDEKRRDVAENLGWRVKRFTAEEVFEDPEKIAWKISNTVNKSPFPTQTTLSKTYPNETKKRTFQERKQLRMQKRKKREPKKNNISHTYSAAVSKEEVKKDISFRQPEIRVSYPPSKNKKNRLKILKIAFLLSFGIAIINFLYNLLFPTWISCKQIKFGIVPLEYITTHLFSNGYFCNGNLSIYLIEHKMDFILLFFIIWSYLAIILSILFLIIGLISFFVWFRHVRRR